MELFEHIKLGALAGQSCEALGRRFAVPPLAQGLIKLAQVQPFAGRFEVESEALCFEPSFPFGSGVEYRLVERLQ